MDIKDVLSKMKKKTKNKKTLYLIEAILTCIAYDVKFYSLSY